MAHLRVRAQQRLQDAVQLHRGVAEAVARAGSAVLGEPDAQRLVLVTGPSGAGRSTAINVLEDLGHEVIDTLPLSLLERLLEGPPLTHPPTHPSTHLLPLLAFISFSSIWRTSLVFHSGK